MSSHQQKRLEFKMWLFSLILTNALLFIGRNLDSLSWPLVLLSKFNCSFCSGPKEYQFLHFSPPAMFPLRESSVLFHQNVELVKLMFILANFLGMVLSLSSAALPRDGCPHSSEGPVCLQIHVSSLHSAQVSSPFLSLPKPCPWTDVTEVYSFPPVSPLAADYLGIKTE